MTARILLVRHAEVDNPQRIVYGRLPRFRLTERGQQQAEEVGRLLAATPVRHIYSSPLLRARQTARAIAAHQPQAELHRADALLEVLTSFQGMPLGHTHAYQLPLPPGNESLHDLLCRMNGFLRRIAARHRGETVICISHGDPIATIRVVTRGLPLTIETLHGAEYPQFTSITDLTYNGPGAPGMTYLR